MATGSYPPVATGLEDGWCREAPGIGAQTATALVAAVGDGKALERGRDLAAWLGLTPRENSTGGKQRLGSISKRGNRYVRTLLVHCARADLETLSKRSDGLGKRLRRMLGTKQRAAVIVALAARLARISWALLTSGQRFAGAAAARAGELSPRRRALTQERSLSATPNRWTKRSHSRPGTLLDGMALRGR